MLRSTFPRSTFPRTLWMLRSTLNVQRFNVPTFNDGYTATDVETDRSRTSSGVTSRPSAADR